MLALLLTFGALAAAVETASRVPLLGAFGQLAATGLRARRVIGYRRCLEGRKERSLRRLSLRMLHQSLRGGGLLLLVAAPLLALAAADALLELGISARLLEWESRLVLAVLGTGYAFARFRLRRRLQPG